MQIDLPGRLDMVSLLEKHGLENYRICDLSVGNDHQIHILLAEKIPEREKGLVPTESNTRYQAISMTVDWQDGGVLHQDVTNFGKLKPDLHFIQRLGDGFLLLCGRAYYNDGKPDQNAIFTDSAGNVIARRCFGDGINQCMVDSQNRIVTSYFDEGIFGNYGWDEPLGACGLILWSATGERLWENEAHDICDCYTINLDQQDRLWFYYYTAFNLVCTDYKTDMVFNPEISGCNGVLISAGGDRLLFDAGYKKHGRFLVKKLEAGSLSKGEEAHFAWNGETVSGWKAFRGSKALLLSKDNSLFFGHWI